MIKQLRLKNYILIDELTIDFDKGLNIITGETGAGKSIIVNAIDLIFAGRITKEVIKTGTDKAIIELTISNITPACKEFLIKNDIDLENEIFISKEISVNSVRSRINGTLVNTETLKQMRSLLIDIHSQNQTYLYMQPQYHSILLDSYGETDYGNILGEYKNSYTEYTTLCAQLKQLQETTNMKQDEIDFLNFQLNEIETAQIKSENEDEELKQELQVLENSEKLKELIGSSYWILNEDDNSILDALNKIKSNISRAQILDNKLDDIQTNFINVSENLKEIASELNDYCNNLENDTNRLNIIQERLYTLNKLKSKYGGTLASVLDSYEHLSKKLNQIDTSNENIAKLERNILEVKNKLTDIANVLSERRKVLANNLSSLIQEKLTHLELPKAKFAIQITSANEFKKDGIDNIEFMISTNISEGIKPLAKVASGGETSRVMLAIKSIFAQKDNVETVIFDEIDSGISGKASQSVADELVELSKFHQIIIITHQAIIASKANQHFYVKKAQNDTTTVNVYTLSPNEHIQALAELASGKIDSESIKFAQSLINL